MSSSEAEKSESDEKQNKKIKFTLKKLEDVKKLDESELFSYIGKLHILVKKNEKKLRKYKDKIKKLLKRVTTLESKAVSESKVSGAEKAQPLVEEGEEEAASDAGKEKQAENETSDDAAAAFSFVDEMRKAAELAQNLNDFVYEPTSGLYYDQKSGYYYNAEYGLYYDGNTGCYYSFNRTKNTFEFHSQVEVQANQTTQKNNNTAAEADDDDDDDIDDEVVFDEWGGVITDKAKLRQIRQEKDKLKAQKEEQKRKKKKTNIETTQTVKSKKRKQRSHSKSPARRDDYDSDSEIKKPTKRLDIEDGELSSSSSDASGSENSNSDTDAGKQGKQNVSLFNAGSRFQDIAKKYPPSLRIVVQETNLEELKIGSLSLITFKGGSLGREGNHDVIIPDVNVSKLHLQFKYDTKQCIYKCIDLGSRNGTVLNGVRMSTAKHESEPHDVVHGSVIQIAQTKLLCHIHKGNSTCGLCEPGLLIPEATREIAAVSSGVVLSHKEQLKKLQKKYGLENEKFVDGKQSASCYNDRAATRRVKVGSSTDKEKTHTASVNTEISSENKGFKMLSKLGWSKGEALGRTIASGGLLEPINVSSNEGKKGLGCDDPTAGKIMTIADKKKMDTWMKTQERYQKADIFCDNSDNSS